MLNARSGLRLIPRVLRMCGFAALAICVLGAWAARAEEPSAAGLWQKIEDGEPVLYILVVDHNGVFEGVMAKLFPKPGDAVTTTARNAPTIARTRLGSASPSSAT